MTREEQRLLALALGSDDFQGPIPLTDALAGNRDLTVFDATRQTPQVRPARSVLFDQPVGPTSPVFQTPTAEPVIPTVGQALLDARFQQAAGRVAPNAPANAMATQLPGPMGSGAGLAPPDDNLTPPGTPAPSEIKQQASALSKLGDILSTPGIQQMLAQFGMALTARDPSSFGYVLGQGVQQNAQGQIERNLMSALLEGREPNQGVGASSVFGASPEAISRATQQANVQREQGLQERQVATGEKRAETEATATQANIQNEQQRTELASREVDLKEFGLQLDLAGLDLKGAELEIQKQLGEARVDIDKRRNQIEASNVAGLNGLRTAQAELARAQAAGEATGGAGNADINKRRIELLGEFADQLKAEQAKLENLTSERGKFEKNTPGIFGDETTYNEGLKARQEAEAAQQAIIDGISAQVRQLTDITSQAIGGIARPKSEVEGVSTTPGTPQYPTARNKAELDALPSGSYFYDPEGKLRRKR